MRFPALCVCLLSSTIVFAQDAARKQTDLFDDPFAVQQDPTDDQPAASAQPDAKRERSVVQDPFAQPMRGGRGEMMAGGFGGEMGGMGMGMEGGDMEGYGMAEESGMMGMGGYGASAPSPDEVFRHGLQLAITALRKAQDDDERNTLRGYIRAAFEKRYETMIEGRKTDIARLKKSVANLEAEMQRREAAKDRVVQLQLQSVQLAAEGILEPNELLPRASDSDPFGP